MNEFKVGDVVKCVDASESDNLLRVGQVYTITMVTGGMVNLCATRTFKWDLDRFELVVPKSGSLNLQIGDIVNWNGMEGTVTSTTNDAPTDYPIGILFANEVCQDFTTDGKLFKGMTEPCLKFVRRAKKKVTKEVKRYVNVYPGGHQGNIMGMRADADEELTSIERIACVELIGYYETEE